MEGILEIEIRKTTNKLFADIVSLLDQCSGLEYVIYESHMEIIRRGWISPDSARESPVRIRILPNGDAWLLVLFQPPVYFTVTSGNEFIVENLSTHLYKLQRNSQYLFCMGCECGQIDGTVTFTYPNPRQQAKDCLGFFQAAVNVKKTDEVKLGFGVCNACQLQNRLFRQKRKRSQLAAEKELDRISTTSNYPIQFLSPDGQRLRIEALSTERKMLKRQVEKLRKKLQKYENPEGNENFDD